MAELVKIGAKADLPEEGEAQEFTVGEKVICVANINGAVCALDNVCLHRGGPLGQGVVVDDKLVCPWHGWQYDPKTGAPVQNPAVNVAVYPLKVEGDDLLVEI